MSSTPNSPLDADECRELLARVEQDAPRIAVAFGGPDSPEREEAQAIIQQLFAWRDSATAPDDIKRDAERLFHRIRHIAFPGQSSPRATATVGNTGHNWKRVLEEKDKQWARDHGFPTYEEWTRVLPQPPAEPDEKHVRWYLEDRNNHRLRGI